MDYIALYGLAMFVVCYLIGICLGYSECYTLRSITQYARLKENTVQLIFFAVSIVSIPETMGVLQGVLTLGAIGFTGLKLVSINKSTLSTFNRVWLYLEYASVVTLLMIAIN